MFRDIAVEDLMNQQQDTPNTIIDVRSPKEFNEATIPGSVNIPVFSNEERVEVGTIYKQVGQEAAKEKGLEIFSNKLPEFIAAFKTIDTPKTVFCWRGGMRSKTAATVLDLMGVEVARLSGGIRAYRNWVMEQLENLDFPPDLYVLNGCTGTGKTIILQKLADMGYPMIDLEGLAGHRGSIFGQIGLNPRNQRTFDAALIHKIKAFKQAPVVFVEGESKRIGRAEIPDAFYNKMKNGMHFFIELPIEERVNIILEEYTPEKYPEKFMEAFRLIKKRIHIPIAKQIEEDLNTGDFANAVKLLLEYYYDPRYEYTNNQYTDKQKITIQAANVEHALQQLLTYIKNDSA